MNRRHLLLATGILALPAARPVAAGSQPTSQSTFPRFSDFSGIDRAISRSYTPVPGDTPAGTNGGVQLLQAALLRFATPDHTVEAFDTLKRLALSLFTEVIKDSAEISIGGIYGLGDAAHTIHIAVGSGGYFVFDFARKDTILCLALCGATSGPSASVAFVYLDYVVNRGKESTVAEAFAPDGGSSGGLWARFPASDHKMLTGLAATKDEILAPAT